VSRPYWGVKVVKVKKKCKHLKYMEGYVPSGSYYECPYCGEKVYLKSIKANKPEGTWVNGENLDKIKFPCFCRFDYRKGLFGGKQGVHGIGAINRTAEGGQIQYQLSWADRQMENSGRLDILANLSVLCTTPSLKRLIELYDIHILKGKIILWEVANE